MKVTKLNQGELISLLEAVLSMETVEECRRFLRDLCTLSELKAMTERWEVAKRVVKGESYREISKHTGASTTTVTRVAHWVQHGTGGYSIALARTHKRGGKS